jgi:hypothetical protein
MDEASQTLWGTWWIGRNYKELQSGAPSYVSWFISPSNYSY